MIDFYRRAVVYSLVISAIAGLCIYFGFLSSSKKSFLLPKSMSAIPWELDTTSDQAGGGASTIDVTETGTSLDYQFLLSEQLNYPYVSLSLAFEDLDNPQRYIDLSAYSSLTFSVSCEPRNTLTVGVYTFDQGISKPGERVSLRVPGAFFTCTSQEKTVEVDLNHLEVAEWWFSYYHVDLSNRGYELEKALGLNFGVSIQSPVSTLSKVSVSDLQLRGTNSTYLYVGWSLALLAWLSYGGWFFISHTRALKRDTLEKLKRDRPFRAYQQLSIEPQKDREKGALLRLMATEYADPELSLDRVSTSLGINRTKVNDILKDELDLTFSAYINKLRLTEAARLLSTEKDANIGEIAYTVGYNNVSYFNKLFKAEYGSTPKAFKSAYSSNL